MKLFAKVGSAAFALVLGTSATLAQGVPSMEGFFVRLGAGGTVLQPVTGRWLPPGYPSDPEVYFDVTGGLAASINGGVGYDFGNGVRAELNVTHLFPRSIDAPWTYTVPATSGPHADMTATASSTAVLATGTYSFDFGDSGPEVTPFVSGGIGVSFNRMGDWTRTNTSVSPTTRTYQGDSNMSLAFSLGGGVSVDLSGDSGMPMFLDISYRYLNLGNTIGSDVPVGSGSSPVEPFNFNNSAHEIGVSVRIPIGRS